MGRSISELIGCDKLLWSAVRMGLLLGKLNETKLSSHEFVTIKRRERLHFETIQAGFID
jgi:hypothetical protein|tara:strand:- start:72 stop:248 length:177 start_codon:yes stop_codon:yes gene_type:complete